MDIKSLSSCQVRWAKELFQYYFPIDYCQEKANRAADTLSRFFQRNQVKEDELKTKITRIFHILQSSLTNATLSGLSTSVKLLPFYQVFIYGMYVLP